MERYQLPLLILPNLESSQTSWRVLATDPDCGVNAMVNYTLAAGTNVEQFVVRSDTGDICITAVLDRETVDYYELPVIATDRGGLSTTSIVRVLVGDVNDNRPIFNPREYNVTLRVDGPLNGSILRCAAVDLDSGSFGHITYGIASGNEAGIFRIDRASGEIFVARPSRLTRASIYLLNISASDAGGLKSAVDALVRITTVGQGEQSVSCDRPRYSISIKENVARNTFIGSVRDSNVLSGSGNVPNKFYFVKEEPDLSLEAGTGAIRTRLALDRETRDRYVLSVEARGGNSIGYCQVELIVEDVNDNPPAFSLASVRISVAESQPVRSVLYVARASDPDVTPLAAGLRYGLAQNGNELFTIDASNGELQLARRLDYESQHRHRLLISAHDGAGLSANLSLSVEVQDVNDNPPVFERNEYRVEVPEGSPVGSQVMQVTAVDLDTGNNARINYRLVGSGPFHVNANSGWVTLAERLDRESTDRYQLTLLATDNGTPAATATTSLLVSVLDENDNDPRFDRELYTFELAENLPSGASLGVVGASDPDLGDNALLRYALVQPDSSFAVDPDTGVITTREPLDREARAVHELVLEARDQGVPSRATRVQLRVSVLDVNDNSPEIVDPQGDVVSVREEQPAGTEVARVRAVDNDLGENATITYTILNDRDSDGYSVFSIDLISGMIKTKAVLDHEERSVYRLSVKASDAGKPMRHSVRALRVEVLALADNRPTFTSSSLTFTVREDTNIGQAVGSVSGAGPAGRVAYSVQSVRPRGVRAAFDVDRASGQLVVASQLDRESVSEHQLEIRLLDTTSLGNPQSAALSVRVLVEDANDNAPRWASDPLVLEVPELAAPGTPLCDASASDPDAGPNAELRYELVAERPAPESGSLSRFAIDSLTGRLSLAGRLDRESVTEHWIVVRASDRAVAPERRLASSLTIRVVVLDDNDNPPVFVAPLETRISVTSDLSPGAALSRVVAVDKDAGENGRVAYTISSGNEEGHFFLGYDSGVVSLARPMLQAHELEITASDHGSPPRRATIKLTFTTAEGQTSGPPRLLISSPVARISEGLGVGSDIMNVAGTAVSNQGNVTFSIPKGVALDKFSVSNSGIVSLRASLDREERAHYSVPVIARSSKLLDLTTLEIFVLDENDNNPEFRSGSCYTLTIPENQESAVVHTIAATDSDEGKNGEILYSIISGNTGSKFKLDSSSGELSASNLDRESTTKYTLTVSAKDRGRPSLETRCNITVIVLDVNDNAPIFLHNQYSEKKAQVNLVPGEVTLDNYEAASFTQGKYATTISEDVAPESSILQVRAFDPDHGANGKISYSIADESTWLFRVDNLTGVITTAGPLDREVQSFHSFVVSASDGGRSEARHANVPVEVYLSDVNDNPPSFDEYPFVGRVSPSAAPGSSVLRVRAHDPDATGPNSDIVYSFAPTSNEATDRFRIERNTGAVTVVGSLAHDEGREYRLELLAEDRGSPSLQARGLLLLRVGREKPTGPQLRFQNSTYEALIAENAMPDSAVVQLTAVRSDGRRQRVAYSIGAGDERGAFAVDELSGQVSVVAPRLLDAEHGISLASRCSATQPDCPVDPEERQGASLALTVVARSVPAGPDEPVLEAFAKVLVHLTDINDNAPVFAQSQYHASVLEGKTKGDFVAKVSASDLDQGANSRLMYHIVDGNPDNAFTIDPPHSGIVRTNIALDREVLEKYRLTVIAIDQGNPQLTGTTALSVRVIDINDNQPTFPEPKSILVAEGTNVGTILTTITANDVDSSPTLFYRFANTSYSEPFSIDRYGGRVILTNELDAESHSEYTVRVIASDGLHEATTELTVRVSDVNDNPPRFEHAAYVTTLSEDRGNIQEVLVVNATDKDLTRENNIVQYRLLNPMKGFTIHPLDGILSVNLTALLKPVSKEIDLTIIAEDSGKPQLSDTCSVVVRLNGLKSNIPEREYKISIREDTTKGTSLMKLDDIDLLDGMIVTGDEDENFEIIQGNLILAKTLDRETKDRYVIRLGAKDENSSKGSLAGDDPVTVIIGVDDVNDNYPRFLEEIGQVSLKEDSPLGHTVAVLRARDDDLVGSPAASLVYDITSGNEAGLFRIEKSSGAILVNASLDCDLSTEEQHLVATACDRDAERPLCTLTSLKICLEDVNDNSPQFAVSEYLEFVGENEPAGTQVFVARASDLDRGEFGALNYSIGSAAPAGLADVDDSWRLFAIDTASGAVSARTPFDYEQRSRYAFSVRATDHGGRSASVRVRVEVDSRDEFHPQFTERLYRFSVPALPGAVIGRVRATDRDKGPDGRVVYQIARQHPLIKLNRTSGSLSVRREVVRADLIAGLDRAARLTISASSGRQGSLSNTTVVELFLAGAEGSEFTSAGPTLSADGDGGYSGADMAVSAASGSTFADWALGLFVALLLLTLVFGSLLLMLLYARSRGHLRKKPVGSSSGGPKPALNLDGGNLTASNSYVDPSAFEGSIAARSVACGLPGRGGLLAPPKYDEIPAYGTSAHSGGTQPATASELSGSSASKSQRSCGGGTDSASDLSVHNTQEYLARLGIVEQPPTGLGLMIPGAPRRPPEALPLSDASSLRLHLSEDELAADADIATLIYGRIGESSRPSSSGLQSVTGPVTVAQPPPPGGPSMSGSLSSIVYSEEELTGSYNWDYLLDWGPQYQPLAHVFGEIARLKDDAVSVRSGNSSGSIKPRAPPPPPLLTCVAPNAGVRGPLAPRSPISHDPSAFPAAALSPSFSPSLSPLATRSPSISPLAPATMSRGQCSVNCMPIGDSQLAD
ncbi:hypothetical protein QAD02_012526 [Eretmocerus hayati]|uniref:Uncharacterized protein n=1 Tax=Eretmocerus hayati TaxID=131215 RepID=A0ACC2P075_9HYME|nr:hypothetical protein QAD02_012526 [Eretmocerus hayati]